MRTWFWLVCPLLLVTVPRASAVQPEYKAGALLVHHTPALVYSRGFDGGLQLTGDDALTGCADQITRIDRDGNQHEASIWFVMAAFRDPQTWAGVSFGLGDYPAAAYHFLEHGPCFPGNGLQIPSSGWPGPNTGIALAVTDQHWKGRLQPIYCFVGYAYSEALLPLAPEPRSSTIEIGLATFPSIVVEPEAVGALGIFRDGRAACPASAEPEFERIAEQRMEESLLRRLRRANPDTSLSCRELLLNSLRDLREQPRRRAGSFLSYKFLENRFGWLADSLGVEYVPGPDAYLEIEASPGPAPEVILTLPDAAEVKLAVLTPEGVEITTLHEGPLEAGTHIFACPEEDLRGVTIPQGVYWVLLSLDGRTAEERVIFVVQR